MGLELEKIVPTLNSTASVVLGKSGTSTVSPSRVQSADETIQMTSAGVENDLAKVSLSVEKGPLWAVPHQFTIWVTSSAVIIIYVYLYLCMFLGGPFWAFDHENYIAFLDNPVPFFFEPGYTLLAYLLNAFVAADLRFGLIFLLLSLPPLLMVLANRRHCKRGVIVFLCVLLKSFYIGFISQRFFFAELWLAALLVRSSTDRFGPWAASLVPGLAIHFSALSVVPSLFWLQSRFSWFKCGLGILATVALYFLVRTSELRFLAYDYSRYLDSEHREGIPFFTIAQMFVLAGICVLALPRSDRGNFIVLIVLLLLAKIIMGNIEVFSRIFQIQTDLIIVLVGLRSRRLLPLFLLLCFSTGFLVLQMFLTPTSAEAGIVHWQAISNLIDFF